jgi:IMP cyclohydrolase
VSIIPKPGHEADLERNPYIAYNCARITCEGEAAVISNGSHTDPIAEKLEVGVPPRDALLLTLLALDYERDEHSTPRIAGVIDLRDDSAWLGTVRIDGVNVRRISLPPAVCRYVATYEEDDLDERQGGAFDATTPEETCALLIRGGVFAARSHPVTAAAVMASADGLVFAVLDEVNA